MDGKIHIGTSGWHYRHWTGPVYPAGMKSEGFLAHYARQLESVEINATFYKLLSPASMTIERSPAGPNISEAAAKTA